MHLPQGFTFVESIEPTRALAKTMQRLTLDDLRDGTFDRPTLLSNPESPSKIGAQRRMLQAHPERYCGVMYGGELVAFMKVTDWLILDEVPFAANGQALRLKAQRVLRRRYLPGRPLGVFALVVSNDLSEVADISIFTVLLERALQKADGRVVNIVIPKVQKRQWLPGTLEHYGFRQVGTQGEAAGAPGATQVRYQHLAS